jgi:hypothetical protein
LLGGIKSGEKVIVWCCCVVGEIEEEVEGVEEEGEVE